MPTPNLEYDPRTQELRRLMKRHGLTTRAVAGLVGRTRQAAKRWSSEHTVIPKPMLDLLKYRLEDAKK